MSNLIAIGNVPARAFWRKPIDNVPFPTKGKLAFGTRRTDNHVHQGIDLFAPLGTRVRAVTDGIVAWALTKWRGGFSGYGRVVVIESDQGPFVLASHLDTVTVQEGDRVHQGETIGTVGKTAFRRDDKTGNFRWSKPHLHFEVSPSAYPMDSEAPRLDPMPFFEPGAPLRMTQPGQEAMPIEKAQSGIRTVATVGGVLIVATVTGKLIR